MKNVWQSPTLFLHHTLVCEDEENVFSFFVKFLVYQPGTFISHTDCLEGHMKVKRVPKNRAYEEINGLHIH